jgi:hypothetical protein
MIENAEKSILVFTPYLDYTLVKLLSKNERNIKKEIVTSLEGENLFQRGYQLKALKDLSNSGVVIKNLDGLHAKVLLIDNEFISLGSQNFTARGRKNKEAGFLSKVSFCDSKILNTLNNWYHLAHEVTNDLIDSLIDYLNENDDEISTIKKRFEEDIENIINEFTIEQENIQFTQSEFFNSTFRFEQGEAIVTKTIPPPNYDYYSFFAGEDNNLCKWIKTDKKGIEKIITLKNYDYYPALNSKTKQMAFLRIHPSRITFMKTGFQLDSWDGLNIRNNRFTVDFAFPRTKSKEANVRVTLNNENKGKAILYYLFNSIEFKLKKAKYSTEECEIFITNYLLNKPRKVGDFLLEQIQAYPFTTEWGKKKEIEKFLPKDYYKVGIMEYKDCPILIFEEY